MSLTNLDTWLFYWINQDHRNPFFDWLMPLITEFDNWKWVLLAAWIILFFLGDRKVKIRLGLLVLLVGVLDYSNSFFFKHLFARPRPCNFLTGVHIFWPCPRSFSFPSNHAANIFGAAFSLGYLYRPWSLPLLFMAALVGYSRVYVGEHYPFDVLAGAVLGAIGAGTALALNSWIENFLKKNRSEKSLNKEP
jgi:undecaprenyl-diphosphatase